MKLFGEYLVERKVISEEILVKALVEQIKALPGTAEVAYHKKLLSPSQMLAVLREQNERRVGFIEAAKTLNFWTEATAQQVENELASVRKPLGQILVGLGATDLHSITHALDDFLSELPQEAGSKAGAQSLQIQKQEAAPELTGFYELFNEELKSKLQSPKTDEDLKVLKSELHGLKGAARLFRAVDLEKILSIWEEVVQEIGKADFQKFRQELGAKYDLIHETMVSFFCSLGSVGHDPKKIEALTAAAELFKFDLSFHS